MSGPRTDSGLVQHRYARSSLGDFVNISDYQPGQAVFCIECERPMIGRQGTLTQWHFAHKGDLERTCSPETALHRLGKAFIMQGFESAVAEKRPFNLRWPCPRCGVVSTQDCTRWCSRIEPEGVATAGVRSDLVLHGPTPCAVEVVVTHDLEEQTAVLYAAAKIPVFIVRPSWDSVGALREEIVAESLRFAADPNCIGCRELDELAKKQDVAAFLARLRRLLERKPVNQGPTADIQLRPVKVDSRGKDLDPEVHRVLLEHESLLVQCGFTRWKRLKLRRHVGPIADLYASLRGTPELSNAADPRPMFYLQLNVRIIGDAARALIREEVIDYLRRHRIAFRSVSVSSES